MNSLGRDMDWFIRLWNVRLGIRDYIETKCPSCGGGASPYFVASLTLDWDVAKVQELAKALPFPTRIDEDDLGMKHMLLSFPLDSDQHPDIYSNNHSGFEDHPCEIISLCPNCHSRESLGRCVNTSNLYWHVHTRHGVLWAYNREHLVELRRHILGISRSRGPEHSRLPAAMLKGSNRNEMVNLIDRVLKDGTRQS
jgi:hypothetical protein